MINVLPGFVVVIGWRCRSDVVVAPALFCDGDIETSGGGGFPVLLPDFGEVFAKGCGINPGGSDGLPCDLELPSGDGVGVRFSHVCFDLVLNRFNFRVQFFDHLPEVGQFIELGDNFIGCHVLCLLCFRVVERRRSDCQVPGFSGLSVTAGALSRHFPQPCDYIILYD